MTRLPIVVVGSGMAAIALVKELRKLNAEIPVMMLTISDGAVYSKPRLSNALSQQLSPAALVQMTAQAFALEQGITTITKCSVEHIDVSRKVLHTTSGEVPYRTLVLATGCRARNPTCEGDACSNYHTLDSLESYMCMRQQLSPGHTVLVLGGGLIGCEVANDLAATCHKVLIVEAGSHLLASTVPSEIGVELEQALRRLGISLMNRRIVQRLDKSGNAIRATLSDGTKLEVNVVISSIGTTPRTELAKSAGLAVGRGIVVDQYLETSIPAIYAMGDCAEVAGVHAPFVPPLLGQARALARTLAGSPTPYVPKPVPITLKTPALPVVICPPLVSDGASWLVRKLSEGGVEALCSDYTGTLTGFALAGAACARRRSWADRLGCRLSEMSDAQAPQFNQMEVV
ncbi:FAD-dependent oxidoreductase [Thermithiobacillus plumbiphilus]|uniref:FAD-dependent oxidoreductase n=1 Tax=Thermithiobacillus plumbiphilus TaxID=1729899 RepID=A0ABU9D716_9PROT